MILKQRRVQSKDRTLFIFIINCSVLTVPTGTYFSPFNAQLKLITPSFQPTSIPPRYF